MFGACCAFKYFLQIKKINRNAFFFVEQVTFLGLRKLFFEEILKFGLQKIKFEKQKKNNKILKSEKFR